MASVRASEALNPDLAPSSFCYAKSLARYISDPSTIRARTIDFWGKAPTLEQCRNLRIAYENTRNKFRKDCEARATELMGRRLSDETKFPCGHERSLENTELSGDRELCRKCQDMKRAKLAASLKAQVEALEAKAAHTIIPLSDRYFANHVSAASRVLHLAAYIHNVTIAEIKSKSRVKRLVRIRWQVMMALKSLGWSFPRIIETVGLKDHTTGIYALRQAGYLMQDDKAFAAIVERLTAIAHASPPKIAADVVASYATEVA